MVDKNKKTKKKNEKPTATVTTGAWWKSAVTLPAKKEKKEEPKKSKGKDSQDQNVEKVSRPKEKSAAQVASVKDTTPAKENEKKAAAVKHSNDKKAQKTKSTRGSKQAKKPQQSKKKEKQDKSETSATKNKRDKSEKTISTKQGKKQEKPLTKLLINAEEPEECRIAQIEDGTLQSFHVTTVVRRRTKNNIYKGRITAIEPTLQAAFVDIGTDRNGFLPFSDIHPEYFRADIDDHSRDLIAQHRWRKLRIEKVMENGQEVLVQVVKEVTGNKGANMTTYLSLPGRYLVLMPGSDSAGVSRKISGEEARRGLRDIMSSFSIPEGIGYIIRTASHEITKTALQKDLRYLLKVWRKIKKKGQTTDAPALIHEDQDVITRFLRDHFIPEIQEIQVDTQEAFDQVQEFVSLLPTKQRKVKIKLHRGVRPIFNYYNIEEQIESIFQPQVRLPSGGSIVINPTEALVAIDVNSGRTSKGRDFEKTIFQANLEAASELARQLRLRDLGGLIVIDFIDMRNKRHIREVEKQVKTAVKRDKAKIDMSRISRFGLMQISRQKMGAPIEKGSYKVCEHCRGRGMVRSVETLALYYLRRIQTGISRKKVLEVECSLPLDVAHYLLNNKRIEISDLESRHKATIKITPVPDMKPGDNQIRFISEKK